ncbi:hypothetical protein TTHERM_001613759 (macronuclear) [Tetrahymena thermophila SB210]|uniref:Uncharacterized protein n=1 Tax=Tetrahymena thermophila (strain SB210) TaxID=312017 RepID=W7XIZ8_TETTS|nr:hypothetical protein TTHERM_001613759 [Tetrahymena thermophila SB210]EWS75061.1 hypothetical protein TTHERM_001613759 [Tetrahymena thermophila SB210]|eukprot:XP_012652374.1 hypothetical protein TTHERM_001613759 [Tetrahymena thermophila SB210]
MYYAFSIPLLIKIKPYESIQSFLSIFKSNNLKNQHFNIASDRYFKDLFVSKLFLSRFITRFQILLVCPIPQHKERNPQSFSSYYSLRFKCKSNRFRFYERDVLRKEQQFIDKSSYLLKSRFSLINYFYCCRNLESYNIPFYVNFELENANLIYSRQMVRSNEIAIYQRNRSEMLLLLLKLNIKYFRLSYLSILLSRLINPQSVIFFASQKSIMSSSNELFSNFEFSKMAQIPQSVNSLLLVKISSIFQGSSIQLMIFPMQIRVQSSKT